MALVPPRDALERMLAAVNAPTAIETAPLAEASGRTLARDLAALRTQPPFPASAMDGYAVRAADLAPGRPLRVIGEAAAGHPHGGAVGAGEAVRIFTGAPVPAGADTILIQENAERRGAEILPLQTETPGRFVRPAGLDFRTGDMLLKAGQVIGPRHLQLAASMGHATLPVRVRPRVAVLSTGDELVPPGAEPGPGQIVSSNAMALTALCRRAGADAVDLGIVPDDADATAAAVARAAEGADLILTSGGASVGDHDFVQGALAAAGFTIGFWKVAVRPGKPLMLGQRGALLAIGLPGNPVSSMVCGLIFVLPVIRKLLGQPDPDMIAREPAILGRDLPANDLREEYMRARLSRDEGGRLVATPFASQDSSIQRLLAEAEALLIRAAHAPAAQAGDACEIIRLT
jgi:molybdopterin molybdotransferase